MISDRTMSPTHLGFITKPGGGGRAHLTDDRGAAACGRQTTDWYQLDDGAYGDTLCTHCTARLASHAADMLTASGDAR